MAEEQPDKTADQRIEIDQSSDNLDSVSIPIMSAEKKRLCIIGAGASGLVSIKVRVFWCFISEGFSQFLFELNSLFEFLHSQSSFQ